AAGRSPHAGRQPSTCGARWWTRRPRRPRWQSAFSVSMGHAGTMWSLRCGRPGCIPPSAACWAEPGGGVSLRGHPKKTCVGRPVSVTSIPMPRVRTGLERLCSDEAHLVSGRRVGLVAHPASVTADLVHALPALREAGATIACILGPEHGVGGEAQDMEGVTRSGDATDVPTHSLYGDSVASLSPRDEWIRGL